MVLTFLFISFSRLPISHYSYFVTGSHHIQSSPYAAHFSISLSCSSVSPPAIPVCYLFSSCAVDSSSPRRPSKETRSAPNQIHGLQITFIKQICVEASNLYTFPRMLGREGDQGRWVPGDWWRSDSSAASSNPVSVAFLYVFVPALFRCKSMSGVCHGELIRRALAAAKA